ncbi:uncharacterized protein F4807DRAFT_457475 [Annulohypoxylon truncatum]|uniref:uncharacterized protein n=1 Tax=Annulohypoxylon truncatum TaxID=327061 RepID=UPI0020073426|nr:uncharacterized protein F4807DRAFT_457475 [Annulohypoxylon truncatum]KAI1212678.1 hypothetical protein F4807DRAFT_457475 [Annulohypoxylon truncatum]
MSVTIAGGAGTQYDWDTALISLEWGDQDWRDILTERVAANLPWEELQRSTLEYLWEIHDVYDRRHGLYPEQPESDPSFRFSPAMEELDRRDVQEMMRSSALTEAQDARDWVQDPDWFELGRTWQDYASESEDWVRDEETVRDNFFTVGLELEFPVAVYRRTRAGIPDPHEQETRWLASDISDEHGDPDPVYVRQVAVDRVLEVLNAQTDMVFVRRDPKEMEAWTRRTDYTFGKDAPPGPIDAECEKNAQDALNLSLQMFFNPEAGGTRLAVATEQDILHAVSNTPLYNVATYAWAKTRARFAALLRQHIRQSQRDRRAVPLPGMKPRYLAFSVYAMPDVPFANVRGDSYADAPEHPFDPYHWEIIKIATPVLRADAAHVLHDALRQICRAVRNNFRVHRDIAAVPVTTQVSVSTRAGFELLDIKRFVTLVTVLRDRGFGRLNAEHRSARAYDKVCGPIKRVSRLGGLSNMQYAELEAWDDWIMPQPPGEERMECMLEMERNMPKDLIPALQGKGKLSDRIFFAALWSYANMTAIARALSTPLVSKKAEVMVKMTGNGKRSNPVPLPWTGRNGEQELYFDVVDAYRGVLEFRQCGGSLDPHHILCWTAICYCVVSSCKFTDEATFKDLLSRILIGEETVLDALRIHPDLQQFYIDNFNEQKGFFEPADSAELNERYAMIDWAL